MCQQSGKDATEDAILHLIMSEVGAVLPEGPHYVTLRAKHDEEEMPCLQTLDEFIATLRLDSRIRIFVLQLSTRERHASLEVGSARAVFHGHDVLDTWLGASQAHPRARPAEDIYLAEALQEQGAEPVSAEDQLFIDPAQDVEEPDAEVCDRDSEAGSDNGELGLVLPDAPSDVSSSSSSSSSTSTSTSSNEEPGHASDSSTSSSSSSSSSRRPNSQAGGQRANADGSEPAPRPAQEHRDALIVFADGAPTSFRIRHKPQANDLYTSCSLHGSTCSRTRTCNGAQRRPRQGRPLGELAAWATLGASYSTAEAHKRAQPSLQQRQEARRQLKNDEGYMRFSALERPRRDNEQSEPE